MNATHPHLHPTFQNRTSLLASNAHRLLFFTVISLALHGMLLAFIPGSHSFALSGIPARHIPVIVSLDTAPLHRNQHQTRHYTRSSTSVTTQQENHSTKKVTITTNQTHPTTTPKHDTTLNTYSRNYTPAHPKHRAILSHTTQAQHQLTAYKPEVSTTDRRDKSIQATITNQTIATNTPSPDPEAVASLLRTALLQHFYYPAVALQNNWQGKVIIGMRVSANGKVQDTHVIQTSGYYILDRAAQHSANAIGNIPGARPLLAGKSLRFRVPVRYQLQY